MTVKSWPTSNRRSPERSFPLEDGFESRFLEGLLKPDLELVLSAATKRRCLANSVVVNQGDPADYFFLVTKGCARYFFITPDGRKVLLHWLGAGEVFGGAALLQRPSAYLVSTEMVTDSWVLVWRRKTIRELAARYPELTENALLVTFDYLTLFLAAHVALISHSARERLAGVLVSLADGFGQDASGGVKLRITNEELANAANVTSFTASRLLSEWQRNGAVVKSRGGVVLRAPHKLLLHKV
jgi:CRP/FNR family transcriptional regulator, nitrogen oxide reductase regulator